jgi:drug/metabolite transporter (DMT)-like permease
MLAAGLMFGCMGVFVKLGTPYFSNMELVFYRSLFGLLLVYAIVRRQSGSLATQHLTGHFWRGASGTAALMLFFYCITVLPLATAVTLNYTSPLFLTLLVMLVLKEHFHIPLTFAITLGFGGVILLLHPTLQHNQAIPGLLGLASGMLAGIALLNVRQLGVRGEPEWRIVFYFSLFATIASGVAMQFDTIHPVTWHKLPILLGMGGCATLAQLAMSRAYRLGQTTVVSSLSYSTIIFASLFGMLIWHEIPPLSGWLGMLLIITSGVLSLRLAPRQ